MLDLEQSILPFIRCTFMNQCLYCLEGEINHKLNHRFCIFWWYYWTCVTPFTHFWVYIILVWIVRLLKTWLTHVMLFQIHFGWWNWGQVKQWNLGLIRSVPGSQIVHITSEQAFADLVLHVGLIIPLTGSWYKLWCICINCVHKFIMNLQIRYCWQYTWSTILLVLRWIHFEALLC